MLPLRLIKSTGLIVLMLFMSGFGIKSVVSMPDYATVYLDDVNRIYIAFPCIEDLEIRPSGANGSARRGTAAEARHLNYEVDRECRESGGYVSDGWPLSGALLEHLGILPAKKHWWDVTDRSAPEVVYLERNVERR